MPEKENKHESGLERNSGELRERINRLIDEVSGKSGKSPEEIIREIREELDRFENPKSE